MKKAIIYCLALLSYGLMEAQDARFTMEISTDSILLGNYFEVKFSLENASGQDFTPPEFVGFNVVSGPNQSMMTSIVNGSMTQSMSYTYYLEPKDIGNYFITAASIRTSDEVLETEPMEVIVLPNPDGVIQKPPRRQQRRMFDLFPSWDEEPMVPRGIPAPRKAPETPEAPAGKTKKKRKTYKL